MPTPDLCTEAEVAELVDAFYARVRDDAILGPVFEDNVADWSRHLPPSIAQSLWYGYQLSREPDRVPAGLSTRRPAPMPTHVAERP